MPRTRALIPTAIVSVAIAMAVAGCESSTDKPAAFLPSASASVPVTRWDVHTGPCGLLTEADATAALGSDPGKGRTNAPNGLGQCDYGGDTGVLIQVVRHSEGRKLFDQLNVKGLGDGSLTAVDGIGDSAVSSDVGVSTMVQFVRGTYFVTILLTPTGDAPTKDAAIGLAKMVAARIS